MIRPIAMHDKATWFTLWKGYQNFYKAEIADSVSDVTFARFFDENEPMFAFVAEDNGALIGMVHGIYHRSCWTTSNYCYLQDLYVNPDMRGKGVGRKLIEAVYVKAEKDGANRVHWLTNDNNYIGQILYEKIATKTGFTQYRKLL